MSFLFIWPLIDSILTTFCNVEWLLELLLLYIGFNIFFDFVDLLDCSEGIFLLESKGVSFLELISLSEWSVFTPVGLFKFIFPKFIFEFDCSTWNSDESFSIVLPVDIFLFILILLLFQITDSFCYSRIYKLILITLGFHFIYINLYLYNVRFIWL